MRASGQGFGIERPGKPLVPFLPQDPTRPVRELGPGTSLGGSVQTVSGGALSFLQLP